MERSKAIHLAKPISDLDSAPFEAQNSNDDLKISSLSEIDREFPVVRFSPDELASRDENRIFDLAFSIFFSYLWFR